MDLIALETIGVAFAMFSALPVPKIEWNERNMRYAMAAFPLIGAVIGALWCVCGLLPLPEMAKAAGFCLIPVAVQTAKDVIELQGFREFHVGVLPKWQAGGVPAEKSRALPRERPGFGADEASRAG